MPDRNIKLFAQSIEDIEALWAREILQIDPPESRSYPLDGLHNFSGILRVKHDGKRPNTTKVFEQQSLSFHYGKTCLWPNIPQAKDT